MPKELTSPDASIARSLRPSDDAHALAAATFDIPIARIPDLDLSPVPGRVLAFRLEAESIHPSSEWLASDPPESA